MSSTAQDPNNGSLGTDAYRLVQLGIPPDHAVRIAAQNRARLALTPWPISPAPDPTQIPPPNLASSAWVPALPQRIANGPRACLPSVRDFVRDHYDEANIVASQLPWSTTGQDVLGTSGKEAGFGVLTPTNNTALDHNWYGMHERAPVDHFPRLYPGQTGRYQTKSDGVTPQFAGGLDAAAGRAFVKRAAPLLQPGIFGPVTPLDYFSALHLSGDGPWGTGKSANARRYVSDSADVYDKIADCLE